MAFLNFNESFWFKTLSRMSNLVRRRVQDKHKNADGVKFDDYSDLYAKRKSEGKSTRKGESQSSRSTVPDMTNTGRTMAELQAKNISSNGGSLVWPTQGRVVQYLAKNKNYRIANVDDKDVLPIETGYFLKEINKQVGKDLKKASFTKIIRVDV